MIIRRRFLLMLPAVSLTSCFHKSKHDPTLDAPNVVEIHSRLVTSGQPSEHGLKRLSELGYECVIYLAPWSVSDAVHAEPAIVTAQKVEFVHIPVPFNQPTEQHFRELSDALLLRESKMVLVHCQVNLRASSLVFLHRAIVKRESPELAYQAVSKVWSPHGPWRELTDSLLRKADIDFEVY